MTRVIIQAIERRRPLVEYLQKHIPGAEVIWDFTGNAMTTFLTTCLAAGDDAVIHIEDDAVLTQNFIEKAEAAIAERPDKVIQFFSRSKHDPLQGPRSKPGATFSSTVCHYLPPGAAKGIYAHYADWKDRYKHPTGFDLLMADYFKENGMSFWVTVPSLSNHSITRSAIDTRRPLVRVTKNFIEPELDGYPDGIPVGSY